MTGAGAPIAPETVRLFLRGRQDGADRSGSSAARVASGQRGEAFPTVTAVRRIRGMTAQVASDRRSG